MKNKLFLSIFFSLASIALYGGITSETINNEKHAEKQEFSFCIREDQQIDTQSWVTFPITSGYVSSDSDHVDFEESIEILFPNTPEFLEEDGFRPTMFTAKDNEGMNYYISQMQVPSDGFNLKESVDFLTENIARSQNKILTAKGTLLNPDESAAPLGYIINYLGKDNLFTRLTIIQSEHFVYFLETNVTNEIYQGIESMDVKDQGFETLIHDSLKHGTFASSLIINGQPTLKK